LSDLALLIDKSPHHQLFSTKNIELIRQSDDMEVRAEKLVEWSKDDPRNWGINCLPTFGIIWIIKIVLVVNNLNL